MNSEQLDSFVRAAARVADIAALRTLVSQEIVKLGFDRFAYVALKRPKGVAGRLYFGTYPPDWSDHYAQRDLWLHDPIMQYPARVLQPFLWDDIVRTEADAASKALVFGPASDAGLRTGAAVPIHGPFGGVALLSVSKDDSERELQALYAKQRFALQIIAYATHDAVIRFIMAPVAEPPIRLSPRQREVLLWTIHGKTNWEIGEILRVSEDTVRQHLRVVCRQLGASNRAQAAAIAVNRAIITPDGGQGTTNLAPHRD